MLPSLDAFEVLLQSWKLDSKLLHGTVSLVNY